MRSEIRNLIERIPSFDPIEREVQKETLAWIDSGAPLCRLESSADSPKHLICYSLPIDFEAKQVLLTDHRKSGLWLPPGGHLDPGEHPDDCAVRELYEELKVKGVSTQLLFLSVEYPKGHIDVALWYLLSAKAGTVYDFDSREFRGVEWFPFNEIPYGRCDRNMERFIQKLMTGIR